MLRLQGNCLVAVGLLLLVVSEGTAQSSRTRPLPVSVHGQIRYAHGGAPFNGAQVRLEKFSGGVEAEVVTDRTGKFQFSGITPALYIIKVHFPGYQDEQRQVDMQTTTSEYVLFQLVPEKAYKATPISRTSVINTSVPPTAQKEFDKAEEALSLDRREDGARHLEKALAIYPMFLEAALKLGTTYMDLGQWDKAEQVLNRALKIDSKVPNLLFALGELNFQRGHHKEAEEWLIDGLKIENRSWQGHFTLGRLYWSDGQLVKAGKQIALTLQLNPQLAEAHLLGGEILLRAGKKDEALQEFEEYLRLSPHGQYSAKVKQMTEKLKSAHAKK